VTLDLNDWLRITVDPLLRKHGYRGGPRRFHRRTGNVCTVIQFQGAVGNLVDGHTKFVVNLGVWHKALAEAAETDTRRCPPALDCHICLRLGELGRDHAERWWDIGQGSDPEEVRLQLVEALEAEALPFLVATGTDDGFRIFWESQGGTVANYYLGLLDGRIVASGDIGGH